MKKGTKLIMMTLGWLLVALGIIGLFLPILQGIILIVIGLYLLSFYSPWVQERVDKAKVKYPKVGRVFDKVDHRIRKLFGSKNKT